MDIVSGKLSLLFPLRLFSLLLPRIVCERKTEQKKEEDYKMRGYLL